MRFALSGWRARATALALAAAAIGGGLLLGPGIAAPTPAGTPPQRPDGGMVAFRSDADLAAFLKKVSARGRRKHKAYMDMAPPPPPSAPVMAKPAAAADASVASAAAAAPEGITNNQVQGVDEGDIVKARGEMLVILRRGRLFTVSTAGGTLRPIDAIAASPPGVRTGGDWYDEMLISGDRVVVVGYSYARGGAEVVRFHISDDGRLRYEDAYQLRSADYYSTRNYASRLIGSRLVFYSGLPLGDGRDPLAGLPAVRHWEGQGGERGFRRIGSARRIFIPRALMGVTDEAEVSTLHTVTSCDLAAAVMDCQATGVLGPWSRTFYVSENAVYLWVSDAWEDGGPGSWSRRASGLLYRLPLNGSRPAALGVRGAPVDQFAFREDASAGVINVLVRGEGGGDAMGRPEFSDGAVALLRLSLRTLQAGAGEAPRSAYRPLPSPGEGYDFQERFVGDYVLYGLADLGRGPAMLVAAPVQGGPAVRLALPHGVERIEQMGADAVIVGSQGQDLAFTTVLLGGGPRLGDRYLHRAASQAEFRSHGFYYRPDPDSPEGASGLLGLPIDRPALPKFASLTNVSAAIVFLRRDNRAFSPLGMLEASQDGLADDHCVASCVDWYGNARPIFLGGRVFALMGYEVVEGRVEGGAIREVRRIDYTPGAGQRPG